MKDFIKETLDVFGADPKMEIINSFDDDGRTRVIRRITYKKKVTSAKIMVEEHFFVRDNDEKIYNKQILIFIGNTAMWGFYKNKFVNYGVRSSGIDNSLVLDLNMKALRNGAQRMDKESNKLFTDIYLAYQNEDGEFFRNRREEK